MLVLLCLLATVHVEVNAAVLVEVGNGGLGHGLGWRVRPVPNPASKQSCDKEQEHDLMHAYFCRHNLCYVHDRY